MRLNVISSGDKRRLKHRLKLKMIGLVMGVDPPDVLRTLTYRADYFGAAFSEMVHEVMRGDSPWSVGERELFAAYISKVNACKF